MLLEIDRTLRSGKRGAGNRESGYPINIDGAPQLFVRRSMRGGMMRFLGDLYVGFVPRMVYELNVISEARKRGRLGSRADGRDRRESRSRGLSSGAVITKAIPGMTMWEFVKVETDPRSLSHVVRMARYSIDTMHEHGLFHDDLNLNNLYVSMAGDGFTVVLLDLTKRKFRRARFRGSNASAISSGWRIRFASSIQRSAISMTPRSKS